MSVLLDIPYQPDGEALLSLAENALTHIRPQATARALCVRLDALEKADDTGQAEDMFIRLGDLLGGIGKSGFVGALTDSLRKIEDDILEDAHPRDYYSGLGGNDPDAYLAGWLEDKISYAQDDFCRTFVTAARAIMAEFGK